MVYGKYVENVYQIIHIWFNVIHLFKIAIYFSVRNSFQRLDIFWQAANFNIIQIFSYKYDIITIRYLLIPLIFLSIYLIKDSQFFSEFPIILQLLYQYLYEYRQIEVKSKLWYVDKKFYPRIYLWHIISLIQK